MIGDCATQFYMKGTKHQLVSFFFASKLAQCHENKIIGPVYKAFMENHSHSNRTRRDSKNLSIKAMQKQKSFMRKTNRFGGLHVKSINFGTIKISVVLKKKNSIQHRIWI